MTKINRQWLIDGRPTGRPLKDSDFKWAEAPVRDPEPGEVLLRTLYLGFDPAQKGWMENVGGYVAPTELGEVMRGSAIAEVVASKASGFKPGDKVTGRTGWQDYSTVPATDVLKIEDTKLLTAHLGVLGTTGMTAYFGLNKIGRPFAGDTLVVTGAAGATGSVVGQIGKIAGCRVIGVAGGADKCNWLVSELGFDAAIDYKSEDVRARLRDLAPGGNRCAVGQCWRQDPERPSGRTGDACAGGHLRRHLALRTGADAGGAGKLFQSRIQTRDDVWLHRPRLPERIRARARPHRTLDRGRPRSLQGGYPARSGKRTAHLDAPLQRRKYGQAAACGCLRAVEHPRAQASAGHRWKRAAFVPPFVFGGNSCLPRNKIAFENNSPQPKNLFLKPQLRGSFFVLVCGTMMRGSRGADFAGDD